MPRAKKAKSCHTKFCLMCPMVFECRRDDKETCSPTCRKRLSREKAAARAAHKKFNPFAGGAGVQCDQCGQERDGRVKKCPVCGAATTRKVK